MRYEEAVDKLLASPRFGERWAGYWLDLARYADSNGYEKDTPRTIWKYRNWVIEAFNEDMPFDRFSTEQLAGDLLPDPDTKQLIATAFHRNTMTNTEGGTDDEEFRVAAVMDRLNTTFEVWQGTTIGCVQCHGHPYDPFRGKEFYQLLAFFNNTADTDRDNNEPKLYEFDERPEEGRRLIAELEKLEEEMHAAVNPDDFAAWTQRFEKYARDTDRPPFFEERALFPPVIRIAQKEADRRSPNDIFVLRSLFIDMEPAFEAMRAERSRLQEAIAELEPLTTPIIRELPAASGAHHAYIRPGQLARTRRTRRARRARCAAGLFGGCSEETVWGSRSGSSTPPTRSRPGSRRTVSGSSCSGRASSKRLRISGRRANRLPTRNCWTPLPCNFRRTSGGA